MHFLYQLKKGRFNLAERRLAAKVGGIVSSSWEFYNPVHAMAMDVNFVSIRQVATCTWAIYSAINIFYVTHLLFHPALFNYLADAWVQTFRPLMVRLRRPITLSKLHNLPITALPHAARPRARGYAANDVSFNFDTRNAVQRCSKFTQVWNTFAKIVIKKSKSINQIEHWFKWGLKFL